MSGDPRDIIEGVLDDADVLGAGPLADAVMDALRDNGYQIAGPVCPCGFRVCGIHPH